MTVDAATAVAALAAAKDVEALTEAIAGASFLDGTPGDDRQKLRGARAKGEEGSESHVNGARSSRLPAFPPSTAARTRLKKMKAEESAKEAAAAAAGPSERSPHAKEVRRDRLARWPQGMQLAGGGTTSRSSTPGPPRNAGARRGLVAAPVRCRRRRHRHLPTSPPSRLPTLVQSYDAGEFEALLEKYDKLNWRIVRSVQSAVRQRGGPRRQTWRPPPPLREACPATSIGLPFAPCSKPGGATVKPDEYYTLYG